MTIESIAKWIKEQAIEIVVENLLELGMYKDKVEAREAAIDTHEGSIEEAMNQLLIQIDKELHK